GISVVGVAVATMALVVTLSVFNGFHDLVASLFTSFDPQLKVTPVKGKSIAADDTLLMKVKQLPEILVATETVEDQALAIYGERQAMVIIKGVENNFDSLTNIRQILLGDGTFELKAAEMSYGIPGIQLAENLGLGYYYQTPLRIFAPKREGQLNMAVPTEGFVEDELYSPSVLFYVKQSKYDANYIITNIAFARNLFGQQGMLSALELRVKPDCDISDVKKKIKSIVGEQFYVKDRFEQQEDTFKIMKIEKFIAYIFLTFILIVACFNIIGSLSMLIVEKKNDITTLRNLGANDKQIARIFLFEGWMISAGGALVGIVVGLTLCWMQQTFGLIGLGRSSGSFIVDAYPVSVHFDDIVIIFITVLAVGLLAVWYPVRYFSRRLLSSTAN
ncbi:MAG: FtsX-like permease family protein, partial [Prevotella sp.]|nr:FtsX-like permease family protein [Prevotella sp.]